jgi:hypothetical protein
MSLFYIPCIVHFIIGRPENKINISEVCETALAAEKSSSRVGS